MTEELILEFDFIPLSINAAYRTVNGRVIKSSKLTEYEKKMALIINKHLEFYDGKFLIITGKIKLEVDIYYCDKRKRDLDNNLKTLIDSLNKVIIDDDHNIYELHARKHIGCGYEKTILKISELNQ